VINKLQIPQSVMKRQGWLIPFLIVAVNIIAISVQWGHLPEILPAHFDLQGNASGSMSRNVLPLYPLIGAGVCIVAFLIGYKKPHLKTGLIFLTSGICLVLLLSTLVTLTSGKMPFFMLAEPIVLLAAVVAFVFSLVKSRKKAS
jgi:hypothetical protein